MKRASLILIFISVAFYFISCTCKTTVNCGVGGIVFRTVGFTMMDADSLLLIRYKADNNFDSVVDTQRNYNNGGYPLIKSNSDTGVLDVDAVAGYDYRMLFPAAGKEYRITKMISGNHHTEEKKYNCEEGTTNVFCNSPNYLVSYTVNGQLQAGSSWIYVFVK